MKKILSLTFAILMIALSVFSFASCKKTAETVRVSVLNGTTGFGMAYLMEDDANGKTENDYEFAVETDASIITAGLINGTIDIAALPTNAAASVYNATEGGVQIMAINTLGVLNIMQSGDGERIDDIKDLEGKTIYCPAQNPQQILNYILKQNNVNATVLTPFKAPVELVTAFMTQKTANESGAQVAIDIDIAVIPQPMATQVLNKKASAGYTLSLDLTEEWNKVSDKDLVQGCVVVNKEFAEKYPHSVKAFLNEYEASIKATNENPTKAGEYIVKYEIANDAALAAQAIPSCNIVYYAGDEMKAMMENFLNALGIKLKEGDFYY
ncbi:MAG: ABC transporter substrate-binding protein [Clostridia bacterium]|nr:ABC transporter substrate-binding protein [Clostridia bacterium]